MTDDTIENGVPQLVKVEIGTVARHPGWAAIFVDARHGDGRLEHLCAALSRRQMEQLGKQLLRRAEAMKDAPEDHSQIAPWRPEHFA